MILKTDRLLLRPWKEEDAESLYQYASDPRIGLAAGWQPHTDVDDSREIIRTVLSQPGNLAVEIRGITGPVGAVGMIRENKNNCHMQPGDIEIGYWIGVPFWGNGYIPEALEALVALSFLHLKAETVWCGYYDGNEKSHRCQSKCGFVHHHTVPDVYVDKLDQTRTIHFTRLTREEWENRYYVN